MSFQHTLTSFLCTYLATARSEWLLLLNQDVTQSDGIFTLEARQTFLSNTNDPTSNSFSIAGIPSYQDFLNNGVYQFRLIYDDGQWERIWTQTSWPTSATITGSSISEGGFHGLGLCHSPSASEHLGAMFDGTGVGSYWFYAVGLTEADAGNYGGKLPVYSGYSAAKDQLYVCVGGGCDANSDIMECSLDSNEDLQCSNSAVSAQLIAYNQDGNIDSEIVNGQLSESKVDQLKAAEGVVIMAWSTESYPSNIEDYTTYEKAVQFTIPNSDTITAVKTDVSGHSCSDSSYYVPVRVECIVGDCNMPETMYTGANFQTVCYGNSYGLVENSPTNSQCDWSMDSQDFRSVYLRSDTSSQCHGVKDVSNVAVQNSDLNAIGLFAVPNSGTFDSSTIKYGNECVGVDTHKDLYLYTCDDNIDQLWSMDDSGLITNDAERGLCLSADGMYPKLLDCDSGTNQIWSAELSAAPSLWNIMNDGQCLVAKSNRLTVEECGSMDVFTIGIDFCDAETCCPNGVATFDWDDLTQKGEGIPAVSPPVFTVNQNDLSLNVVIELQYLGKTTADRQRSANFGTTYVLDFEDFDAHKDRINEPGTCQNRKAEDFIGGFDTFWSYSLTPQLLNGGIGSSDVLAYPPPPSDKWTMYMKDNGCDTVVYEGHFTWAELRECQSYANDDSHIYTEVVSNQHWLNLTGMFYINVVSPIWYGATDLGYYRVYQLLSQPFVIAVSTSIQVLASTGINLMTMSVIAVYKDDSPTSATANQLSQDFKLVMMTEVAEYLKLTRNNNELFEFSDPNSINTNSLVGSNTFDASDMMENGGDCLQNTPKDSYICSQLWVIKAEDKGCTVGEIGTDFSGKYSVSFTPECRETTNAHCNGVEGGEQGWLADHSDIADGVTLSTDLTWKDEICDPIIFKVQFEAEMLFYQTSDFTEGANVDADAYMFQIGAEKIYVEIRTNFPEPTLTIFNAELVQVHICTFADGIVPPSDSNDLENMGCYNSQRDAAMDEYFYDIWPIGENEVDYVNFEVFTEGLTNIVRFAFDIPEEVGRDRLYVHAQIEVELQELWRRRRVLLDVTTPTANQMRHFGDQIGVRRNNKPIPPIYNIPNPSNVNWTNWFMTIASAVFAIVLMAGVCGLCYWKFCTKTVRYHKVGYVDSEFDSEAGMIDNHSSN